LEVIQFHSVLTILSSVISDTFSAQKFNF